MNVNAAAGRVHDLTPVPHRERDSRPRLAHFAYEPSAALRRFCVG